jgi:hypothetical protein
MMQRRLYFLSRPYFYASFDHFFRDRLVPGALMLLDDYAYRGHCPQKVADRFLKHEQTRFFHFLRATVC